MLASKSLRMHSKNINLLPIEKVIPNVVYTLTLSINHRICPNLKLLVNRYRRRLIKTFHPYCTYEVFPELSTIGRLHYHGVIKFDSISSIFMFYRNIYTIKDIHIEIDTIEDKDIWMKYVHKQSKYKSQYIDKECTYKLHNST